MNAFLRLLVEFVRKLRCATHKRQIAAIPGSGTVLNEVSMQLPIRSYFLVVGAVLLTGLLLISSALEPAHAAEEMPGNLIDDIPIFDRLKRRPIN